MDSNHYVQAMMLPNMEVTMHIKMEEMLDSSGQTKFRCTVGKLTALAHSTG